MKFNNKFVLEHIDMFISAWAMKVATKNSELMFLSKHFMCCDHDRWQKIEIELDGPMRDAKPFSKVEE